MSTRWQKIIIKWWNPAQRNKSSFLQEVWYLKNWPILQWKIARVPTSQLLVWQYIGNILYIQSFLKKPSWHFKSCGGTVGLEDLLDMVIGKYLMASVKLPDGNINNIMKPTVWKWERPFTACNSADSRYACVTKDNAHVLSTALEWKIECVLL